eukprot:4517031-Prymnesium_polylepis.1
MEEGQAAAPPSVPTDHDQRRGQPAGRRTASKQEQERGQSRPPHGRELRTSVSDELEMLQVTP